MRVRKKSRQDAHSRYRLNPSGARFSWIGQTKSARLRGESVRLTLKGTILGTVTDASGAAVPKAQIVVIETGTNSRRAVETNENGFYAIANLDPGVYRIEAEHTGFSQDRARGHRPAAEQHGSRGSGIEPGHSFRGG